MGADPGWQQLGGMVSPLYRVQPGKRAGPGRSRSLLWGRYRARGLVTVFRPGNQPARPMRRCLPSTAPNTEPAMARPPSTCRTGAVGSVPDVTTWWGCGRPADCSQVRNKRHPARCYRWLRRACADHGRDPVTRPLRTFRSGRRARPRHAGLRRRHLGRRRPRRATAGGRWQDRARSQPHSYSYSPGNGWRPPSDIHTVQGGSTA